MWLPLLLYICMLLIHPRHFLPKGITMIFMNKSYDVSHNHMCSIWMYNVMIDQSIIIFTCRPIISHFSGKSFRKIGPVSLITFQLFGIYECRAQLHIHSAIMHAAHKIPFKRYPLSLALNGQEAVNRCECHPCGAVNMQQHNKACLLNMFSGNNLLDKHLRHQT